MLPEWFNRAVEMYKDGDSFLKIGKSLNIDRKKVSKILNSQGYKTIYSFRTLNGVNRDFDTWRKYNFNENFFDVIDTERKAYWLGFMYADGYVNSQKSSCEISVKEMDIEHLDKLLKDVEGDMPITHTYKTINEKKYKGGRVTLNSKTLKKSLIDKGCLENKSLILKFPSYDIVPKELMRHFIRGYFDGDGSLYSKFNTHVDGLKIELPCIEFIGTEAFLDKLMEELGLHKNKIHDLRKDNPRVKRINYNGRFAHNIISYMYSDSTIYLERKYKIANGFDYSII